MFVTGMYWLWAVALVVLGVVADLIAGAGRFRNKNLNLVSFLVFSLNPMGSYLMLVDRSVGLHLLPAGKGTEQAYLDTDGVHGAGVGAAGHDRADAGVRPGERAGGSPSAEEAVREGWDHRMNGGTSPRQRLWLDPRTKILLLLLCIFSAMIAPSLYYELGLVVLIGLFGVCCGKWKYAWKGAAFYALIVLLTFWIMDTMTGTWRTMFIAFLGLFHKVYPCGMLSGIVISTTKSASFCQP